MKLAQKFTFECGSEGILYTAERDADGTYIVTWDKDESDSVDGITTYEEHEVERNIVQATWRVLEVLIGPESPYEPADDHPYLDPSIEVPMVNPCNDLVDLGVSLSDVRRFTQEITAYTVELDAEFIAVKPLDRFSGGPVYVVKDEGDLAAVFQAIRTLERFADRG